MARHFSLLSLLLSLSLLVGVFSFAYAGSYQLKINGDPDYSATYEGLVPCGKCLELNKSATADLLTEKQCGVPQGTPSTTLYLDCQLCHLFVMVDDIIDTVIWRVVPTLAIIFFFLAGIYYMASGDDPVRRKRAFDIIRSAAIGVALVYGAWLIVNTIFSFTPLVNTDLLKGINPGGWFNIECPISY